MDEHQVRELFIPVSQQGLRPCHTSIHRLEEMESFLLEDISSIIQNTAIERIISPMTVQLCHLIISMERKDMENEVFASLEEMAEELAQASEDFVQVAKR